LDTNIASCTEDSNQTYIHSIGRRILCRSGIAKGFVELLVSSFIRGKTRTGECGLPDFQPWVAICFGYKWQARSLR